MAKWIDFQSTKTWIEQHSLSCHTWKIEKVISFHSHLLLLYLFVSFHRYNHISISSEIEIDIFSLFDFSITYHCHNLKILDLSHCAQLPSEALAALKTLKSLQILKLNYFQVTFVCSFVRLSEWERRNAVTMTMPQIFESNFDALMPIFDICDWFLFFSFVFRVKLIS
jgi:hypothetical protein